MAGRAPGLAVAQWSLPVQVLVFGSILFAAALGGWLFADPLLAALEVEGPAAAAGETALHTLVWVTGAFVVIGAINVFFWDGLVARLVSRPVPKLLKRAFAFVVFIVAVTGIVGVVFERNVTGIWATSGVLGIVLGFALRNMLQDVFTGIALNLDGAIKTGDWVRLHHRDFQEVQYGKVTDINWRTSRVQLVDNTVVVVPNSLMGMMAVTNFAHSNHTTRLEVEVVLDFSVPPARATEVMLAGVKAATGTKSVLANPKPDIVVSSPTERGTPYRIRFWGRVSEVTPDVMQDHVLRQVLEHLHFAGITPSYPKGDLFHARMPKRDLAHHSVEDRVDLLARLELFGNAMTREEIASLAARMEPVSVPRREALVRQGDKGTSMFIVVEGALDVLVATKDDETPVCIGHVGVGQIIGEMSLLTGEPRSASVVAATDVVAYEIGHEQFAAILRDRPAIAEVISALVAERRIRTSEALRGSACETETERRRVQNQILGRMKSAFVYVLDPSQRRRKNPAVG